MKLTKKELIEICFSLMQDKVNRSATAKSAFESGRRKLLKELKLQENPQP
jgi:hypothetical protein